jgi:hypothetical protein
MIERQGDFRRQRSRLICRLVPDIIVRGLKDLSEHEKNKQCRDYEEPICGISVADTSDGIKEDKSGHQEGEKISLDQLKAECLFRGDETEAEGEGNEKE